jgi:predicted nucleic acid-binding Zn ribbon protein
MPQSHCSECSLPIVERGNRARFCSDACKSVRNLRGRHEKAAAARAARCRRCLYCTAVFEPDRDSITMCGADPCRRARDNYQSWRSACIEHECPTCSSLFSARADKRYCSDPCNPNRRYQALLAQSPPAGGHHLCSRCETVKPLASFCADLSRSTGLNPWCKPCQNEKSRETGAGRRAANRRRARKQKAQHIPYSEEQLQQRLSMWGFRCWVCGIAEATESDHVKPIAAGGADILANIRPCCSSCNASKGKSWPAPRSMPINFRHPAPRAGSDLSTPKARRHRRPMPTCQQHGCSKPVKRRGRTYCSNTCSLIDTRKAAGPWTRACPECSAAFVTSSPRRVRCVTCSPSVASLPGVTCTRACQQCDVSFSASSPRRIRCDTCIALRHGRLSGQSA